MTRRASTRGARTEGETTSGRDGRRRFLKTLSLGTFAALSGDLLGAAPGADGATSENLSGEWSSRFDPKDAGIAEKWFDQPLSDRITLPGSTATAGLGNKVTDTWRGMLTPEYRYVGAAWYRREIEIPDSWKQSRAVLRLERVLWRSRVWVDGREAGNPVDLLAVPHEHDLGILKPGKHTIAIRIDNREIHATGAHGHHYYEGMQTIWNGIVGEMELDPKPLLSLGTVRFFPSYKDGTLEVEVALRNDTGAVVSAAMTVMLRDRKTGEKALSEKLVFTAGNGVTVVRQKFILSRKPAPWDEFTPNLYAATVSLGSGSDKDAYSADIGFRDLGKTDRRFTVNGRTMFVRGNHDGCVFPLTGYPPTDVAAWRRILKIYKDHGLNLIRFHSWTPPEAAFVAADELGVYIQSEHFWCRPDTNADMTAFARSEVRASLDRYGNHPSMCYVLLGNELGGDLELYGKWLGEDRAYDPRHMYSVAAGRRVKSADDFCEYGAKMNWAAPFTDWDYSEYFQKYGLPGIPEITHELGQPSTHPDWNELKKYTGVLKPRNLEGFREAAKKAGVEAQSAHFQKASGNINRLNYKADIEALLRTPESAGYGLLDMHDYPGQGEALVGWLDAFYEPKGFLDAKEFRKYGGAIVPLARFANFSFTEGETLTVKADVAHYGPETLKNTATLWSLEKEDGTCVAKGALPARDIPAGDITRTGEFSHILGPVLARGEKLRLKLEIAGTGLSNDWYLWVFPKATTEAEPADVLIVEDADQAVAALRRGRKVLLLAHGLGRETLSAFATFKPPFWSVAYFNSDSSAVSGAVIRDDHPALALFPTDDVLDRQWQPLCSDARDYVETPSSAWRDCRHYDEARGFDLSAFPTGYRPIVQPVCDFHFPLKIGTVFELCTKAGGRLMVCGYDLAGKVATTPAARQLRRSLLHYMASPAFEPRQETDDTWILRTFEKPGKAAPMPEGFETAFFHIKAGGRLTSLERGRIAWSRKADAVAFTDASPEYSVKCDCLWSEDSGSYWTGAVVRIEIVTKAAISGILKVRFADPNRAGRSGVVRSVDGQEKKLGDHVSGGWIEFRIRREDSLEGKIFIEATRTTGPNLMVSEIALVPGR